MTNYSSYSDKQLLALMKDDDETAFEAIYHKYWRFLFNSAYKILHSIDQSKDTVSDVLLNLWERRSVLDVENLPAYLKTAIRFRALRLISSGTEGFFELFEEIENSPYHPDRHLYEKEMMQLIEAWANLLPAKRRTIFIKHFFAGLNTREIADELNISQKTVQNQLGNAVSYLYSRFNHLLSIVSPFFVFLLLS